MENWQKIREGKLAKDVFIQRAQILDLIREWFKKEGFLEVETPIVLKYPGMEPHLDLFSTEFVSKDGKQRDKRYLHTSPEYAMKKLLAAEFEKVFQLCKVFRNGEWNEVSDTEIASIPRNDSRHNPEFTMLEWYRAEADYEDIMKDTEGLIKFICRNLIKNFQFSIFNFQWDLDWERLSVREAFQRYADMNLDELRDLESLRAVVEQKSYSLNTDYSWDDLFFLIMLNEIEPKLGFKNPVFLYDYPASQAALAKRKEHTCEASGWASPCKGLGVGECEAFWAERFELYINGVELCNAFSELIDPVEQRQRLEEEQELRKKMGKEVYDLDESFLEALKTVPPSGGNALGIDRLVMVLLGKKNIEEVLLFPWG